VITFLVLLAIAPLVLAGQLLGDFLRLRQRWRHVPVQQKNLTRATAGAFGLVACIVLMAHGFPVIGSKTTAGIAAFAVLYLVAGIAGARGAAVEIFMSVFWWGALIVGGAALLTFAKLGVL
jgi:hypothetical protein